MADENDKPKQPPKVKISVKGKSRKLPKIKLSESQVSRPKKDTSKVPKIGVETNPKAETSRIPLPDSIKAKGLKIGKLAEDIVPHQYTDEQLAEAAKRRTMRVEIAEEVLDEDTIIATPEELGIKTGNRDATIPIDPTSIDTASDSEKFDTPSKSSTAELAKSSTAQIDPLSIVEDSQEIESVDDKKSTVPIDPQTTTTGDTDRLKPLSASTAEIAKAVTAQIDPLSIVDDSQEIHSVEDKKSTVAIDPSTTHTGDTDQVKPANERDELAKATTAKIDPSSIIDDSQPLQPATQEIVPDRTVEIDLVDIEDSVEIQQVEEPAAKAPPAPAPEVEGIIEAPAPDSDIFKATTMAMDVDELEAKIQDEDTAIDKPNPEIFKAQTMDLNEMPEKKPLTPKTVKLKKPAGAMPSTVKLKKGKPAAPKADTTRVDLPEGADAPSPKPAKTVMLKRPKAALKPTGSGLKLDSAGEEAVATEPDFEFAATGTDDGPGALFSILSLASLLVSFGVIYFLYSSITLINSY